MSKKNEELVILLCRWQAKQELCVDLMVLLDKAKEERDALKEELKKRESAV